MDNKQNEAYLREAIELARSAMNSNHGGPFGALVVKEGLVVGRGGNQVTSSCDPTAHGEIMAIRNASQYLSNYDLTGCTLYTSCEPCPMCLGAIYWARLDAVYFAAYHDDAAMSGFDDQFIYQELDKSLSDRQIPFYQKLQDEGKQVFREWDQKPNKITY